MAKLLTPAPIITPIQTTDKASCTSLLQIIFATIKAEHS